LALFQDFGGGYALAGWRKERRCPIDITCSRVTAVPMLNHHLSFSVFMPVPLAGHMLILEDRPEVATEEADAEEHDNDISEGLSIQAQRINRATWEAHKKLDGRPREQVTVSWSQFNRSSPQESNN
jgi:hypothetical protein